MRACRFRFGFLYNRISLAANMHSLVRSSKRMLERRQFLSYCGVAAVSFEEQILARPNALSPANFRLFAPPYLGYFSAFVHTTTALSVSRCIQPWRLVTPNFPREFRRTVLKTRPRSEKITTTWLSHSMAGHSRPFRLLSSDVWTGL